MNVGSCDFDGFLCTDVWGTGQLELCGCRFSGILTCCFLGVIVCAVIWFGLASFWVLAISYCALLHSFVVVSFVGFWLMGCSF